MLLHVEHCQKRVWGNKINYSFHYIIPQNNNNNSNNSLPHPDRRLVLIVRPANALGVPDVGPVEEGHGGPGGEQKDGVQADHCLGVEPGKKENISYINRNDYLKKISQLKFIISGTKRIWKSRQ